MDTEDDSVVTSVISDHLHRMAATNVLIDVCVYYVLVHNKVFKKSTLNNSNLKTVNTVCQLKTFLFNV